MANGKLSRAHVGLALASALVVLLASGVAISRISEEDDESPVATGPSSTSSSAPAAGPPGSAVGSGRAGTAGSGGMAEQAAPVTGKAGSGDSAVTHGVTRTARDAAGNRGASAGSGAGAGSGDSAGAPGGATAAGSGSPGGPAAPDGSRAPGAGGQGGGQESPPAPSQTPPEPLANASVSAGEGAQGAVVGIGLGNSSPVDADVTIGDDPVIGDHPPSEGTGVSFGGRLLQAPPTLPLVT